MNAPVANPSPVARLPELVALPAFHVAGPARLFDEASKSEIPQLWSMLLSALPFEGQSPGWTTYGVVCSFELYDGRFDPLKAGSVIDFHIPVEA